MYKKKGIDYFTLACAEERSERLIRRAFGLEGVGVVVELYRLIFGEQGYYAIWDCSSENEFAIEYGIRDEKLKNIVEKACEFEIFDSRLYEEYRVLTSSKIQEFFFSAVSRRSKVEAIRAFLLVDPLECLKNGWEIVERSCTTNVNKTDENVCILRENVDNLSQNADILTQRKEKKKKTKEKQFDSARTREDRFCESGSFETDEFFRIALQRSYGKENAEAYFGIKDGSGNDGENNCKEGCDAKEC